MEINDLYGGWHWRRSRDLETLAWVVYMLRSMMSSDEDYDAIVALAPGYDQERAKQVEAMKQKAFASMKKKRTKKRG